MYVGIVNGVPIQLYTILAAIRSNSGVSVSRSNIVPIIIKEWPRRIKDVSGFPSMCQTCHKTQNTKRQLSRRMDQMNDDERANHSHDEIVSRDAVCTYLLKVPK